MTYKEPLIEELKEKFQEKPNEVVKDLVEIFKFGNTENQNIILIRTSELSKLIKKQMKGIVSDKDQSKYNEIYDVALNLINEITEEEAFAFHLSNSILKRILIVCRTKERLQTMKDLFPKKTYHDREVIFQDDFFKENTEHTSLIIYDDFPRQPFSKGLTSELKDVLNNSGKIPLLFFSPDTITELHKKYSERVYFSNSIFSIHSRIKEMLLYLRINPTST